MTDSRQKTFADIIQTVEFSMHIFNRSGVLTRYMPQSNGLYSKDYKEEGFWTTVYYNAYVTGYNTRLYQRVSWRSLMPTCSIVNGRASY